MVSSSTIPPPRAEPGLLRELGRTWWLMLLRGLAAIAFGVLALLWPAITLIALALLYGAYALVDGVFSLLAAVRGWPSAASRWWLAFVGVLGIGAGMISFFWPNITALVLVLIFGAWSLVRGVLEIVGAVRLRKIIDNEWWLVLNGALSAIVGLLVLAVPSAGALALVFVIAVFALLSGVLLVVFSLRLKRLAA